MNARVIRRKVREVTLEEVEVCLKEAVKSGSIGAVIWWEKLLLLKKAMTLKV